AIPCFLAAQTAGYPLGHIETAHRRGDRGVMAQKPAMLGQRELTAQGFAGPDREHIGADLVLELGELDTVTVVVPGNGRTDGRAVAIDQHTGLAHARDTDAPDTHGIRGIVDRSSQSLDCGRTEYVCVDLDAVRSGT